MNELVFEKQDKPMTDSLKVSEYFKKNHKEVLRDIRNLECSEEFGKRNFAPSFYISEQGHRIPKVNTTFDGFMFLAMGYRGKKAAVLKEAYIKEFNRMSDFIHQLDTARLEFHDLADAIKEAHKDDYHNYHFSNELDLINRIVLGTSTRKFKKEHGIEANTIRPELTPDQLSGVIKLQRLDIGLLMTTPAYEDRKQILSKYYGRIRQLAIRG
jgi:Rha family phage regulatory protein